MIVASPCAEPNIMSLVGEAKMYARFAWRLRKFLRTPFALDRCRAIIRERLQNRDRNLLELVKRAVYENPRSPYRKLLKAAGCEYGDLDNHVRSDGVERTLEKLRGEGVYLSAEEFKGKKDVVRGGCAFRMAEKDLDNPLMDAHLSGKSGGSRSAGTRTSYDLNYLAFGRAVYTRCLLDALHAFETPYILWAPITPGFGPLELLSCAKMGKTPDRWFSPVSSKAFRPSLAGRMATRYIIHAGNLFGARFPAPEYVPLDEAGRIARWVAAAVRNEGGCCVDTYTSNAARICKAAQAEGLDLTGATFLPSGEPLTPAKLREIESTGARACTRYIFSEGGYVGFGCLKPTAPDDVHFLKDSLAFIRREREVPHADTSVNAWLFTTLMPYSPKVLLNVENGDYGVVETRQCGCDLEALGFTEHFSCIRGFDKLTGEGMTFIGTDLLKILEDVLPSRFGGFSTDYQMMEEEDPQGRTLVTVLVSPEVSGVNESDLIEAVLAELGKGKAPQRLMAQVWSDAKTLRVRRERPLTTSRGKLLPLHISVRKHP